MKNFIISVVTMFLLLTGCAVTGTIDREAEGTIYVVPAVYDGCSIITNGNEYIYETDVLEWETLTIKGEPSFHQIKPRLVESDTLVHIKFNDMGTPDVTDDIPVIVAYDRSGMHQKLMAELDALLK